MPGKVRIFGIRTGERGASKLGIKTEFALSYCYGSSSQFNENQNRNKEYNLCLLGKRK